ncbi:MAG TPA: hypothetical protein VF148_01095 [Acidimicrobiia bacterium]
MVAEVEGPLTDVTNTYVKPDGTGHLKDHLPHGVCTLIERKSTDAFVITMAWVKFLQGRLGR